MQLGAALGTLLAAIEAEGGLHADVDAWYAPSECHGIVARASARRFRTAVRSTGWTRRQLRAETRKRMGRVHADRFLHFSGLDEVLS